MTVGTFAQGQMGVKADRLRLRNIGKQSLPIVARLDGYWLAKLANPSYSSLYPPNRATIGQPKLANVA